MQREFVQFIKFNIVGVMNTIIDMLVYMLLIKIGILYVVATTISYSIGVINSYFWNRKWTFQASRGISMGEVIKFIGVNIVSLLVSIGILTLFVRGGWNESTRQQLLAKGVSTFFAALVNFLGNKKWVFRK